MRLIHLLGVVLPLASACAAADLGDCPSGSDADQAAGRAVIEGNCTSCHSFNLDNLARSDAQDMYTKAEGGDMPPSGALSDQDVEKMRIFLTCQSK